MIPGETKHSPDLEKRYSLDERDQHPYACQHEKNHQPSAEKRRLVGMVAIQPRNGAESIEECGREDTQRVPDHAIPDYPMYQPWRIGDRTELDHDKDE